MCSNIGRGKNLGGRTHNTLAPRCRGGTSRVGVQPKACTLEYSQGLPGPVPLLSLPFKAAPGKNKPYDSGNLRVTPDLVHPGFSTADSTAGALTTPRTLPAQRCCKEKLGWGAGFIPPIPHPRWSKGDGWGGLWVYGWSLVTRFPFFLSPSPAPLSW